ncbi:MAG: DUF4197 domain-containing protein [Bacteroidales bacterium]
MRTTILKISLSATLMLLVVGCGQFNFPSDLPLSIPGNESSDGLTKSEVVKGLKEALTVGAQKSTEMASKTDGFYGNSQLFIPFPPEAVKVKETLESAGIQKPVDDFVLSLNRAAEDAARRAFPIFRDAIIGMTISDAMGILNGNETAATEYLRRTTTEELKTEFNPVVRQSIAKVKVTSYWNPIAKNYNRLTMLSGGDQVNPDLEEYITERTVEGLFMLIAKEEALIRKDPSARVTEILRKVFGN